MCLRDDSSVRTTVPLMPHSPPSIALMSTTTIPAITHVLGLNRFADRYPSPAVRNVYLGEGSTNKGITVDVSQQINNIENMASVLVKRVNPKRCKGNQSTI